MKFLHTGDLHIGRGLDMKPLIEDQRHILNNILTIAKETKPDFLIIAGDIYDRSVPREEAVNLYDDFITQLVIDMKIKVFAISGNHDSASRIQGMNTLLNRAGYYVEGNLSDPPVSYTLQDEFGDVDIHMVPFKNLHTMKSMLELKEINSDNVITEDKPDGLSEETTVQKLKNPTEIFEKYLSEIPTDSGRNIIILHNYFSPGADPSKTDISDSERPLTIGGEEIIDSKLLERFDYAALGHLHKAQRVGSDHVRYAGSILKYSTSEIKHNKSVTLVNMDGNGKISVELIPLVPLRDYRKLTGLLKDVSSIEFDDKKEDYITVELLDETLTENPFNILSNVYPNLTGITFSNIERSSQNAPSEDVISKQDTYKLFSSFFEANYSREMNDEESEFIADVISEVEESLNDPD